MQIELNEQQADLLKQLLSEEIEDEFASNTTKVVARQIINELEKDNG